ncbi:MULTISPECIES: aminotransferase class IV family protein [Thermomonospora]|uniref:Aminotransferase class IV n=1 Tax=Thermomonospora curvata (strain ATCC 19995 / DSM 43183 / JCM 3096 / KCTC 9072 / NBRC 15933 / NCIMB 10081 / Henssen B9) TaxID=471852 RepID=D1ADE9_THECD|nr:MULTISPECIES: aminotransferase class IV family protein [Thermomonospora]ACY95659.1 aminotransferase class IV [Thermomonospora curvata DSM 43183]PKK16252.1 MAG: aminotransferase [Thermomonospora sp. CIF 1]
MAELDGAPVAPEALQALGLINYGHFTSMRVDDQHVRGLSHHLDRLVRDCREVFDADLNRDKVREYIRRAIRDKPGSFVVRVTVFDPDLELGRPGATAEPRILVTTRPAGAWPPPPMRVQSASYRRDLPHVKHIGLFGQLWCRRNAQLNGFDDALFIDSSSFVTEGATWNIGFYDGDRVIWPSADVLPGVTMRLITQVHEQTITAPVNLRDVPSMEAAFATNTTVGVRPITAIDNVQLPAEHPIFETLRKEYEEIPPERI